jgi:hypothetical protein
MLRTHEIRLSRRDLHSDYEIYTVMASFRVWTECETQLAVTIFKREEG